MHTSLVLIYIEKEKHTAQRGGEGGKGRNGDQTVTHTPHRNTARARVSRERPAENRRQKKKKNEKK